MSNPHQLSDRALGLVAQRFKALSDPTRLKLIMVLRDGEKNVGQLVHETGATQANVSRHLQTLLTAGILSRRKQGVQVFYSIRETAVFDLCDVVCGSLKGQFSRHLEAFG